MSSFDHEWEKVHQQKTWGRYPSEEVIRFVARNYFAGNRSTTRILDLGCGGGANSWFLSREGFQTFAFDGSLSALQKCNQLLQSANEKAGLFQADAAALPISSASFDAIIDSAAISANSISGIEKILSEAYRILKPGGKLFSTGLFSREISGYGTGQKIEDNTYRNLSTGPVANIGTIHFFDREEIEKLFETAGFHQLCIDTLRRTDLNETQIISYFLVTAQKPA